MSHTLSIIVTMVGGSSLITDHLMEIMNRTNMTADTQVVVNYYVYSVHLTYLLPSMFDLPFIEYVLEKLTGAIPAKPSCTIVPIACSAVITMRNQGV